MKIDTPACNPLDLDALRNSFLTAEPFNHVVIDNFWTDELAEVLYNEFPQYDAEDTWNGYYKNPIENKKACNRWDKFPETTYQAFTLLGSQSFVNVMSHITNKDDIFMDMGLHGGGWHCHADGGNLNLHLDYNIHPKLGYQRQLNIIIYMSKDWDPSYGGGLELWSNNPETNQPLECVKTVDVKFNRAVIFDTTQNSWHGLPYPLRCPPGITRNSFAAYYLGEPPADTPDRPKALFAPRADQIGNTEIETFIKQRSNINFNNYKG